MKTYISGKMTGLPEGRIQKKFKDSEEYLRTEGYTPVNPAVLQAIPGLEYTDYMVIALAMLSRCDAIFVQSDWEFSEGAKLELHYARLFGLKIIYESELIER